MCISLLDYLNTDIFFCSYNYCYFNFYNSNNSHFSDNRYNFYYLAGKKVNYRLFEVFEDRFKSRKKQEYLKNK